MYYMKFRRRHLDPYSLTNLIEYIITTHVSLYAALSVSLGLARAFSVTTNYVLTSVFWVWQAYENGLVQPSRRTSLCRFLRGDGLVIASEVSQRKF